MKRTDPAHERDAAEALALSALAFLAEDPDRLGRFLALSGLGPGELRERAADPALLGGVLDHLLGDERLLIAFAERHALRPDDAARARRHLPGGAPDWE